MNKDNFKLSIHDVEYHINRKKKRVGCHISYKLKGDPKFIGMLYGLIRLTWDPMEWELTAYATTDPGDEFNVDTGMKVARAKAESMAYQRVANLLNRVVEFNRGFIQKAETFTLKASNTIDHNREYLSKF